MHISICITVLPLAPAYLRLLYWRPLPDGWCPLQNSTNARLRHPEEGALPLLGVTAADTIQNTKNKLRTFPRQAERAQIPVSMDIVQNLLPPNLVGSIEPDRIEPVPPRRLNRLDLYRLHPDAIFRPAPPGSSTTGPTRS